MNEVIIKEEKNSENMIYEVRGEKVILDRDLAILYNTETRFINQSVKRNSGRFPTEFCFQLNEEEFEKWKSQNVMSNSDRMGLRKKPYAFTEQGVAMLSGLLKSDIAIQTSIKIIKAFVIMKKYISSELLEQKYVNNLVFKHDNEIKLLQNCFNKLKYQESINEIYFEGQIYDAYSKIIDIMSLAKDELIIIDNYADKSMLDMISKANSNVILITKRNNLLKQIDIDKYNKQYHNLKTIYNNTFHDRYIIIDNEKIYHCGTSLNHIGSKTFLINLLEDNIVKESLLNKIKKII